MIQASIKQRILGFLVLIALAVIILPTLLDGENGRTLQHPEIPPRPYIKKYEPAVIDEQSNVADSKQIKTDIQSSGDQQSSASNTKQTLASMDKQEQANDEKLVEAEKAQQENTVAASTKKSEQPTDTDTHKDAVQSELAKNLEQSAPANKDEIQNTDDTQNSKGNVSDGSNVLEKAYDHGNTYVIQVGSFSQLGNAKRLNEKLKKNGLKSFLRSKVRLSETIHVVYVGQFATKKEASDIKNTVEEVSGLKVMVHPFQALRK